MFSSKDLEEHLVSWSKGMARLVSLLPFLHDVLIRCPGSLSLQQSSGGNSFPSLGEQFLSYPVKNFASCEDFAHSAKTEEGNPNALLTALPILRKFVALNLTRVPKSPFFLGVPI